MEPLSATVATIVTGFLTKGATEVAKQVGQAASNAAQTLAQAVLDRLKADPKEERTVERYEQDPAAQQPALEAAVADLIAADAAFSAQLEQLVRTYRAASGDVNTISIAGPVRGPVVQGSNNTVVGDTSGTVRIGDSDSET